MAKRKRKGAAAAKSAAAPKASGKSAAKKFTELVAVEANLYRDAKYGEQMARIAHFRVLSELVKADDACRAEAKKKKAAK